MIHSFPGDRRQCRTLTLPNGLRALLLSDPAADQAGAAMGVGAGSGDEPSECAGLAHLLEHLLFLGTERYPSAEDFPAYVQGHGGRYNATTELDQTRYFFEIPSIHLDGALDRFAQFFIAPRLTESAIAQEREVIDAEYRALRQDDEQCILGVIKQVLDPSHPASRFLAGNRETLNVAPESLRRKLTDFRQRYYTAVNLQLAVVASEPLDTLERQVRRCFADIPPGAMSAPTAHPPLLIPGRLPLRLALQPTRCCHELRLCFPVPALRWDDYLQPWEYLAQLLAFRGSGSLYDQLMNRGWLTGIDGSVLLETRPQAMFQIRLRLTPEGMGHTTAITAAVFDCLGRIEAEGIAEWRHRERRALADQRFRLAATPSTMEFVKSLVDQLHRYPRAEALRGPYRLDAFRPGVIRDCLAHLTPDNLLAVMIDPDTRGDRTSPWFPASYRIEEVFDPEAARWDSALDFLLPPSNPFIMATPDTEPEMSAPAPRLLRDNGQSRMWYQPFAETPGGGSTFYLNLAAMFTTHTLADTVLTELLIVWLERELAADFQQARAAGLEVTLGRYHQGITLTASGFPEQLERLLQPLSRCLIRTRLMEQHFDQARLAQQARWEAQRHDHAFRRLLRLPEACLGYGYGDEERLAELAMLSRQRLQAFRQRLLHGVGIDCLMVGPMSETQAQWLADVLEARLLVGEPTAVERCRPPVVPLQAGQAHHYRLDASGCDSAVALYLPGASSTPLQEGRYRLLAALLHDAFFRQLRIEQQLGYVVLARYLPLQQRPGLILLVQSPSLTVNELQRRIHQFLTASDALLPTLDNERFIHYRDGLLQNLQAQQRRPIQQAEQFWAGVTVGDTDFQRPRKLLHAISELSLDELQRFYQEQLLSSPWVWLHT